MKDLLEREYRYEVDSTPIGGSRELNTHEDFTRLNDPLIHARLHVAVEDFSRFLIRTKTLATITTAQHPVLGCWANDPRPMPDPTGNEVLYREMLGWADFG